MDFSIGNKKFARYLRESAQLGKPQILPRSREGTTLQNFGRDRKRSGMLLFVHKTSVPRIRRWQFSRCENSDVQRSAGTSVTPRVPSASHISRPRDVSCAHDLPHHKVTASQPTGSQRAAWPPAPCQQCVRLESNGTLLTYVVRLICWLATRR